MDVHERWKNDYRIVPFSQRPDRERSDSVETWPHENIWKHTLHITHYTLFRQLKIAFKKNSAFICNLGLHEKKNTKAIGKIHFLVRQNLEAENEHKILLVFFFFTYRYCQNYIYCYKITFPWITRYIFAVVHFRYLFN